MTLNDGMKHGHAGGRYRKDPDLPPVSKEPVTQAWIALGVTLGLFAASALWFWIVMVR